MRTFILTILLVSAALPPCWAQQDTSLGVFEIREHVMNLGSRDSQARKGAIAALVAVGPPVIPELRIALPDGDVISRKATLDVLAQIEGDEADSLVALLAVTDSREAVRKPAIALLRKRSGKAACDTVIDLARSKSAKTRNRAIALIRALRDPAYIDRLIARLPRRPRRTRRAESAGNVGLGIDMTRSDLRGYDDYSTTLNIEGREVRQNIRMPIFGETSIKTQAVLSAGSVLRSVTGRGYGEDAARWRKWWAENRKRYERAK